MSGPERQPTDRDHEVDSALLFAAFMILVAAVVAVGVLVWILAAA